MSLGFPQGSILGPLFSSIFINDLPFVLNLHSKLFADDTTLYITFDLKNNKCGDEPAIKSGNIFSWLKGKDHSVKSVEGKPSFKLESIVQYCMSFC